MANFIDYNKKVLEIRELKKYFTVGAGRRKLKIPAVDGVSFDVFKREVFGVVGESGSGKTTLGRTIIKLYNPTDGTVKLNDTLISFGYQKYLETIYKTKQKLKDDIKRLNPIKIKKLELINNADQDLMKLNNEIKNLRLEKNKFLNDLNKELNQYRSIKHQKHALMEIEVQKILFDYNQKVLNTKHSIQNESRIKFNNELKIIKNKYKDKAEGIKNSGALEKNVINDRLIKLNKEFEEVVGLLKSTYEPQIQANQKKLLSKSKAKELLKNFKLEKNNSILFVKSKYENEVSALAKPNYSSINQKSIILKLKYKESISKIKKEIKSRTLKLKKEIALLPRSPLMFYKNQLVKDKIKKLKHEANLIIQDCKSRINEAKALNSSKASLKASQNMQMIFQDPISSLNPRMTVKEIISEGLVIQGKTQKKDIETKVSEVLSLVGLSPDYASRYPHEFSGGQRQRIGVARALIMNPNVIIADEPISALDVSIRAQVINLLFTLREKLGLTILFIAHDLSVVRFFCDRIAVMFNGKIVEMAPSDELFKNPMHPYTISLLSAIPQPDPDYEKNRKRIHYNPSQHNYDKSNLPTLKEISPRHYVLANEEEFLLMKLKN
jgi:oligopeptide transport system ATP-binding protein